MHQIKILIAKASIVLLVLLSLWSATLVYAKLRDSASIAVAQQYIDALENYISVKGSYPKSLDKLQLSVNNKVLGFLPSNKIIYKKNENAYIIYYKQFPLGPGHVYSSQSKKWYFDEI
ncbi:hypothetical protein [Arsukibacterium sp.]|uniref:hypothetical protein n=1 Tax=Arsukibacterium sp. TaxID=1977258 RepID=UPI001BD6860F|nr:hypothetical protein [Arsukibacterium sp.]